MKSLRVFETVKEPRRTLEEREAGSCRAAEGRNLSCIIDVDVGRQFQMFKGFGCALTESSGYVLSFLPEERQLRLFEDCFSESGNRYAFARTHMNSCDFSLGNWACMQEADETLVGFSFDRTDRYITPILKKAAACNGNLSVMVTPWSPPAWMKTNNDMNNGGKIKECYRRLWAEYFVRFLGGLKERGLRPAYVSVQNESEALQAWESCIWTGREEAQFAVDFLKPAFMDNGLADVKILVWDHNRDRLAERMKESFSVSGAEEAIDGMAYHWYSGDHYGAVAECARAMPGKDLFFSEGCVEGGARPGAWFCGERYGHNIINDLNAGCTAWIDWNMALDMQGGPNHAGNTCDAPLLVDIEGKSVLYQSSYYYIGQFSRFIVPGSRRLAASIFPFMVPASCDGKLGNTMESTAFATPDGKTVVVVMNRTEDDMVFELNTAIGAGGQKRKKVYTEKVTGENLGRSFVCPPRAIQTYIIEI